MEPIHRLRTPRSKHDDQHTRQQCGAAFELGCSYALDPTIDLSAWYPVHNCFNMAGGKDGVKDTGLELDYRPVQHGETVLT